MISFDEFIAKYNGKGVDFDGYYGFQCYDLAHQYAVECVGKDVPARPGAKDLWDCTIDGYDKVANTPDGVPPKGAIVIWGTALGAWGHVAIAISGNKDSFTSFDQNFPLGSVCHVQQHNYTGVLGWFVPKIQITGTVSVNIDVFENLVKKSSSYDQFVTAGYTDVSQVLNIVNSLKGKLTEKDKMIQEYESQLAKVPALTSALEGLKNDVSSLTAKNEELLKQVVELKKGNKYTDGDVLLSLAPLNLRLIKYVS